MDLTWSLEDVAKTSEDAAVRRMFASRNRTALLILLIFFGFVAFIQMVDTARDRPFLEAVVIAANALLVAFSLFFISYAFRDPAGRGSFTWRAGARLREHVSAAALAFIAIEYAVQLWIARGGSNWIGWAVTLPLFMLGFRMLAAELVLLHLYLAGGAMLMLFNGRVQERLPLFIGFCMTNGVALAVELYASRRLRREVAGAWASRRTQAREQIRMRDELRYARELQLSMLPESAPKLDWADICSICVPATEVGGDYFDYFVEDDRRLALVCGDVAGHGMASGLVLSAIRSGFTLLRDELHDPAAVLGRLHDLVAHTTRRRMLVTVSVVLIDRVSSEAIIASAGHPPVILRRADGSVETIDLFAPPLGVRLPLAIPQRRLAVTPGDLFVLHSDGVYETRNARDESYGMERLERVVREHGGNGAEHLRDAILRDVAAFRGAGEQDDDVTLVVCGFTG